MKIIAILSLATLAAAAASQTTTHTGCVTTGAGGTLTFCEQNQCSVLSGSGVGTKLWGHIVTVRGTFEPATATTPNRMVVSRVVSIGATCTQTGSTDTSNKPGSEGGTPGAAPPPQ